MRMQTLFLLFLALLYSCNACTVELSRFSLSTVADVLQADGQTVICGDCQDAIIRNCQTVICTTEAFGCRQATIENVTTLRCESFGACEEATVLRPRDGTSDGRSMNVLECTNISTCNYMSVTGGFQNVRCLYERACRYLSLSDLPRDARIECAGALACSDAEFRTTETEAALQVKCYNGTDEGVCDASIIQAAHGIVDCRGGCSGATITNAQSVNCDGGAFVCSTAEISGLTDTMSCRGEGACFRTEVYAAADASISVDCGGEQDYGACDLAEIRPGPTGKVDCQGGCSSATILGGSAINCTAPSATSNYLCSNTEMEDLSDGAVVTCAGSFACSSGLIASLGSIDVLCEGEEACSASRIMAGPEGSVVCRHGACMADVGDVFLDQAVFISAPCLDCRSNGCPVPSECRFKSLGNDEMACKNNQIMGMCDGAAENPTSAPSKSFSLPPSSDTCQRSSALFGGGCK